MPSSMRDEEALVEKIKKRAISVLPQITPLSVSYIPTLSEREMALF